MTNTEDQKPSYENLVSILIKTREKLATALFQTIDLEAQLEEAKSLIIELQNKSSDNKK